MRLSHSLPIIEDAVFRLGLSNEEIAYLLETEVERRYLNRGQIVQARVSLDGMTPGIRVSELPPLGSDANEIPVLNPLQPNPQAFLECVESYHRTKTGQFGWELALARCISVDQGFSVVELHEHPTMTGEIAVLPHSRLAVTDRRQWCKGRSGYVVVARAPTEHRDGIDVWHSLNPKWLASRTDSIFLRRLVNHFFGLDPVMTELYSGIGMVVLDEHAPLGAFVGKDGENVKALEMVSGARQVVVVRKPGMYADRWRLKKAIQQLTPVKRFTTVPPAEGTDVWTIVVHPSATKLLVGSDGCRLMFISRLAGLRVEVVERTQV